MKDLSIIIPCYNEAKSLDNLFTFCRDSFQNKLGIEFIFVNNGSTDNTNEILEQLLLKPENNFARLVNVPINKGYGYGILQGLFAAEGNVLAWTHADLQTDPIDVINAYDKYKVEILNNQCIVKGKRKKRNLLDVFFTFGMSVLATVLLKHRLSDINAQPKIFNREFLIKFKVAPYDFSLDLFLLYEAKVNNLKIETFPVFFNKRVFGESKGGGTMKGKIKLTKRTIRYMFELKKMIKNR